MTSKNMLLLLLLLFTSSCSIFVSAPQTTYFDLGDPLFPDSKNYGVDIKNFSSDAPAFTKMIFRKDSNEIKCDAYNNWAQTPQAMLTKYMTLYFNNPRKQVDDKYANNQFILSGNIYNFECNIDSKEALLNVKIKITKNETVVFKRMYSIREKMSIITAFDFSKAMAQATLKLAQQIETDINKLDI